MDIATLAPREKVALDRAPIEPLCRTLGADRAEVLVGNAMDEMAGWLSRSERLCRDGNRGELARVTRLVETVARKLGMDQLATAAGRTATAAGEANDTTLAAVTARMQRLGSESLTAIWNLQGLSV